MQRGALRKRGKSWSARFYDENGARRERGGFTTKSEAGEWLDSKLEAVGALRDGDVAAVRRRAMPTLAELVAEYLGQHNAEANTLRTLKARLRYATEGPALDGTGGFAVVRIDRLNVTELGAWRKRLPERSAWAVHKALRQVLHYAVRAKLLDENPAAASPTRSRSGGRFPRSRRSTTSRPSRLSSAPASAPWRSSGRSRASGLRNGSRSNAATSTERPASSVSAASTQMGR